MKITRSANPVIVVPPLEDRKKARSARAITREEKEQCAAFELALEWEGLKKAKKLRKLLEYLYDRRCMALSSRVIGSEFSGVLLTADFDSTATRGSLASIRGKLLEYQKAHPTNPWIISLPDGTENDGYQLTFTRLNLPVSPSEVFWKPHLQMIETTRVISGAHLFFHNKRTGAVLRYYDVNTVKDKYDAKGGAAKDKLKDDLLADLKAAHPEQNTEGLEPWQSIYLATGDVQAYETLMRWFHARNGVLIERITSRDISEREMLRLTPILIGRPRTNPFIKSLLEADSAAKFGYRVDGPKGTIKINNIRENERRALKDFSISPDGVVSAVADAGIVFGIVTRLPSPGDRGYVTIIACDYYALMIARIVEVMTVDKQAQELLAFMEWPDKQPLPNAFEMLFVAKLSPGDLEGEGYPQLRAWRPL